MENKLLSKKNILLIVIFLIVIIGGLIYFTLGNHTKNTSILSHANISYTADSLEDLYNESSAIIEGTVKSKQIEKDLFGITFVLTEIKVTKVLKGNGLLKDDTIVLLQTKVYEDPIVKKGSKKILFLTKYEGPITEDDAYVCTGLYQGNYTLNRDNKLSTSVDLTNNAVNELTSKTKDELEKDIANLNKN